MTLAVRQRGQALILLAAWLLLTGGAANVLIYYDRSAPEMEKAIKHTIADDDRKNEILRQLKLWEPVQEMRDEQVAGYRKQLLKMLRNKATQRTDLTPTLAQLDAQFSAMDRDFLDLRFQLKAHVTRAEWAQIVARPDQ